MIHPSFLEMPRSLVGTQAAEDNGGALLASMPELRQALAALTESREGALASSASGVQFAMAPRAEGQDGGLLGIVAEVGSD
jgi:hypothetical protein